MDLDLDLSLTIPVLGFDIVERRSSFFFFINIKFLENFLSKNIVYDLI